MHQIYELYCYSCFEHYRNETKADKRRREVAGRKAAVRALGMKPETDFTYAASSRELYKWLNEKELGIIS